jgi:hypothetical protein
MDDIGGTNSTRVEFTNTYCKEEVTLEFWLHAEFQFKTNFKKIWQEFGHDRMVA